MRRWLRRVVYLLIIVVWLVVMSLPVLAFSLAGQGELWLGDQVRLFLVQEPTAEGVGVEWTRPLRAQPACARTTVTYIMWAGQSENTAYCRCLDENSGAALPATDQACDDS